MADSFSFEKTTRRYRNKSSGRFVSAATVRRLASDIIALQSEVGVETTNRLFSGEIPLQQWESEIAANLKELALQLYKLGRGDMGQRDYGIIGNGLRNQYRYLRNFALEVAQGRHSEAMIQSRLDLYYAKSRLFFERGQREGYLSSGANWERRIVTSSEPCAQCPGYAALGWQRIGSLPNITEACDCKARCKCRFEYSFSRYRPQQNSLITSNFGWTA